MRVLMTTVLLLLFCLSLIGCDRLESDKGVKQPRMYDYQRPGGPREQEPQDDRVPPAPPIQETFDAKPQLSLFPRVGDYQPDREDERFPFWKTFIDHFTKVSGLLQDPESENRAWSFRGINTIDSVAFFSPIGVEPQTAYRISYKVKAELPEEAKTGIGVLEFSKFLWIGEQYTEKTIQEYLLGSQIGVELTGDLDWEEKGFILVTGPQTKMIHLVFYREGEHSRKPVLIDDVEIVKAEDRSQ
jgi:hypothetical protein